MKEKVRSLGEQLDAHRKRQQGLHPDLTMTGMYNVLEKLRAADVDPACRAGFPAEPDPGSADAGRDRSRSAARQAAPTEAASTLLTDKEKAIHEKGLVSVLKQIHDELDAAVFDAYGWPHDLTDEEILERLVALNHERAEEEERGLIRWLRPEFQNPAGGKPEVQHELELDGDSDDESDADDSTSTAGKKKKSKAKSTDKAKAAQQPWPRTLSEQIVAVRSALQARTSPAFATDVAKLFKGRKTELVGRTPGQPRYDRPRATDGGRQLCDLTP